MKPCKASVCVFPVSRPGALLLAAVLLAASAARSSGQNAADAPCDKPVFRQFDFWIGEWNVRDASGKPAGRNVITAEENGCVLIERWRSASGATGMSMNHYDPQAGRWKQHWVGLGLVLEMSGGMKEGSMVLEGPLQYLADSRVTLLRGVWTRLEDGRVRQHFLESDDDGATWSEWFDGYYSRAAGAPPAN